MSYRFGENEHDESSSLQLSSSATPGATDTRPPTALSVRKSNVKRSSSRSSGTQVASHRGSGSVAPVKPSMEVDEGSKASFDQRSVHLRRTEVVDQRVIHQHQHQHLTEVTKGQFRSLAWIPSLPLRPSRLQQLMQKLQKVRRVRSSKT